MKAWITIPPTGPTAIKERFRFFVFGPLADRNLNWRHEHSSCFMGYLEVKSIDVLEVGIIWNEERGGILIGCGKGVDKITLKYRGAYRVPLEFSVMQR